MSEFKFDYYAPVDEGTIPQRIWDDIDRDLKEFGKANIHICIKKRRKNRSLNQNAYYWGVIVSCFQQGAKDEWEENLDKETAHNNLKQHCNFKEVVSEVTGEVTKLTLGTKDLNTLETEEYYDRCRKLIHTFFNINVPLPGEQTDLDL